MAVNYMAATKIYFHYQLICWETTQSHLFISNNWNLFKSTPSSLCCYIAFGLTQAKSADSTFGESWSSYLQLAPSFCYVAFKQHHASRRLHQQGGEILMQPWRKKSLKLGATQEEFTDQTIILCQVYPPTLIAAMPCTECGLTWCGRTSILLWLMLANFR